MTNDCLFQQLVAEAMHPSYCMPEGWQERAEKAMADYLTRDSLAAVPVKDSWGCLRDERGEAEVGE